MQRIVEAPPAVSAEQALLERIASGDRDALAELYRRYQRPLFRFLRQLTPDRGLAEEILQDTLVAVWKGAGTFKGRSPVSTWLFGIARRQAHDALRRKGVAFAGEEEIGQAADPGPPPEERALARDGLAQAVRRLAPVHREVLALAFVSGLGYQEIAEALEVPEGTVKSRLFNARRALRRLLEEEDG